MLLLQGNALRIPLADESVHTICTSPPYWGLRKYSGDMAQVWGGDPECAHEWDIEKVPSAQPISDKTGLHKDGRKTPITEKYRETLNEYTPRKFERGYCIHCGAWYGELGLEPTPELYVANMVAVFREVRRVLRSDGTVWLNLGDSYAQSGGKQAPEPLEVLQERAQRKGYDVGAWGAKTKDGQGMAGRAANTAVSGLKPKDLCGIPWRVAFALQADGWWLRSDIIWSKPNPMPESVTDRPTKAHEYLFLLTKSARYYYDADAVREPITTYNLNEPGKGGKIKGTDGISQPDWLNSPSRYRPTSGRNRRTVWHIATAPYSGAHFATYPPALVEPCIKAGTSERGVCPECGAPWERVIEKGELIGRSPNDGKGYELPKAGHGGARGFTETYRPNARRELTTLGWQPTCECAYPAEVPPDSGLDYSLEPYQPVPATVFDPFAGSGTTLQVARALGRHGVGLDLSLEYLHLARTRLSLDALDAWGTAKKDGKSVLDLPLFEEL